MSLSHEIFHVVALVAFLGAMAVAFLGLAAPVIFDEAERSSLPRVRTSLLLGGAAAGGLIADWVTHKFLS